MTNTPLPRKLSDELRFTQNFLKSPDLVQHIVDIAAITSGLTVLEIGPGKGIITRVLAAAVSPNGHVVAVELDAKLAAYLTRRFSRLPQVIVVNGDILNFRLAELQPDYTVFSNVPFSITSELLDMLFSPPSNPVAAHLILQNDALIGSNAQHSATETFKSLMIKPLYQIDRRYEFSRADYDPRPAVDTSLFSFTKRSTPLIDVDQYGFYKDYLAVISKDRVGEGRWTDLFSKSQLKSLVDEAGLVAGRGLKSQSIEAVTASYSYFVARNRSKLHLIKEAMSKLRQEQRRKDEINREGGHRRGK